jgi:hypothetical protein
VLRRRPGRRRLRLLGLGAGLFIGLAILAVSRSGLLGLPPAPGDLTPEQAGLAGLDRLASRARALGERRPGDDVVLARAVLGLEAIAAGDTSRGLALLRTALGQAPTDLVLGNAYRMTVFGLKRAALTSGADRATLAARMPPELEGEPLRFLDALARAHPCREVDLQRALSWVDEMLLFPALEIKAPASVASVDLLSGILAREPWYVPALFGRGLNYLHRPSRLVWPESEKAPPEAARRDLERCVAAGRKVGGASPRLVGSLALALGDAYAKEGRRERARSWWQIAANAAGDPALRQAVERRFAWEDAEMIERLEAELENEMLDAEHPMTDLALIWGREAP